MNESLGEILFLRVPPRGLVKAVGGGRARRLPGVFTSNGFCGRVGVHSISCFWIGMGRRVRRPGQDLLDRIRGGRITDIVDIGCAGALDPSLKRGDLVLSSEDMAYDRETPVPMRRRPELWSLLYKVAAGREVALHRAPILTHERFISSCIERSELFKRTGCVAVQMEHVWFLELLRSIVPKTCFDRIRITHLALITDMVPRTCGRTASALSAWDALRGYALPGGSRGIMSLRREVLSRWPGV